MQAPRLALRDRGVASREGGGTFRLVAVGHRDLEVAAVAVLAPLVNGLAATTDIDAGADEAEADTKADAVVPEAMCGGGGGKRRGSQSGDGGNRDDGLAEHVVW